VHHPTDHGELLAVGESSRDAELRYSTDTEPGISRRRFGRGLRYLGPDSASIRDAATLARIRALAIPPAWKDVWICRDARGICRRWAVTPGDASSPATIRRGALNATHRSSVGWRRSIARCPGSAGAWRTIWSSQPGRSCRPRASAISNPSPGDGPPGSRGTCRRNG
jgi:hypothetical protein